MKTINKIPLIAVMVLIATMGVAMAEDAPAMWMVQTDDGNVDLMVNTSENSSGANAHIHFDPMCINITSMNFSGSPWQPLVDPGWSHQAGYIIMVLTNIDGVEPGEYQIASMTVECLENCTETEITITNAEPVGVITYNLTYNCTEEPEPPEPPVPEEAMISIADGTGIVSIPIMIENAENVGAVDVTLTFDPEVVRVTGVEDGAMDCTYTNLENVDAGWIRTGAIQGDNLGLEGDHVLVYVEFEPVGQGAMCDLEITVTTYKEATPEGAAMNCTTANGIYTSSLNGDVNGDGVVDIADANYLAKNVIGISGYETIDAAAADVDDSGNVDMADVAYLTRYVIGMIDYAELR